MTAGRPSKTLPISDKVRELELKRLFKEFDLGDKEVLRCVVMPDTHFPHHHKASVEIIKNFIGTYDPHVFLQIGDFWEMEYVSHWKKNVQDMDRFVEDIAGGKELMKDILEYASPDIEKIMLMGNHEYWVDRFFEDKMPNGTKALSKLGVNLSTSNMLLQGLDFDIYPYNDLLKIGNAYFTHGFITCDHHAKKMATTVGANIYYGHVESIQTYSLVSVKGLHEASSLGTMRDRDQASFLGGRPTNWGNSFGIFEFRKDGAYTRYIPIIVDGVMSFNGELYDGNI